MRERRLVDEYNRIKFDSRCYNWPGLRRATVSLSEPLRSRSERELNITIGGSPQICSDTHREEVYKVKKKKSYSFRYLPTHKSRTIGIPRAQLFYKQHDKKFSKPPSKL